MKTAIPANLGLVFLRVFLTKVNLFLFYRELFQRDLSALRRILRPEQLIFYGSLYHTRNSLN